MTKEEAIKYCYDHRDEYVRGAPSIDEGIRQFGCLITRLGCGTIEPEQLADHGMEY